MTRLSNIRFSWYWLAVCGLLLVVLVYSLYKLSESPPTWFDEGVYIQVAHSLTIHGQYLQTAPGVLTSTGQVTGGYSFLAPVALSMHMFGDSLLAARAPMVLFILLCVCAAFLLIYKLYGPRDALLSLMLLVTFPLLYGNGKNVLGEVPGMFYTLLALYFLWRIEQSQFTAIKFYIGAGFFIGLAAATKPIFFLLPAAVGLVFLCNIRFRPWSWKGIVLGVIAFALPLILWAYLQFGGGDGAASILQHYANPYAEGSIVSTAVGNFVRFFKEATPLYCAALMALWIFSVGIRIYRKERIALAEWSAFIFSLLILVAYLRTAGWYRYFFEAMTLALLFAPTSLRVIAQELTGWWPKVKITACIPILLILLGILQFYQLNFSSWVADHYQSTQTAMLEHYFSSFPTDTSVLVYNTPEIVPFLHTDNYYQYFDIDPNSALAYGRENLPLLAQGVPARVIVTASDYQQHMSLFERYKQDSAVGSYLLLLRQ